MRGSNLGRPETCPLCTRPERLFQASAGRTQSRRREAPENSTKSPLIWLSTRTAMPTGQRAAWGQVVVVARDRWGQANTAASRVVGTGQGCGDRSCAASHASSTNFRESGWRWGQVGPGDRWGQANTVGGGDRLARATYNNLSLCPTRMHHTCMGVVHPLFALTEGGATSSRACPDASGLTPTSSARQGRPRLRRGTRVSVKSSG